MKRTKEAQEHSDDDDGDVADELRPRSAPHLNDSEAWRVSRKHLNDLKMLYVRVQDEWRCREVQLHATQMHLYLADVDAQVLSVDASVHVLVQMDFEWQPIVRV